MVNLQRSSFEVITCIRYIKNFLYSMLRVKSEFFVLFFFQQHRHLRVSARFWVVDF